MKKRILTTVLVCFLLSSLVISVFADSRTGSSNTETGGSEIEKNRILLLENALEPKEPYAAAESWAEGVKTRNGALQYAVMSQNLKDEYYPSFAGSGWVTGVSSPWVESFEIAEVYRLDNHTYRYKVVFTYTDSTKSYFSETKYVTVNNYNDSWLIFAIEKVDIKGEITKLTINEGEDLDSIFVEDPSAETGNYDKANVIIGSKTKIYEGYTDNELAASDLKEEANVIVTFTDDPSIMIYPVSAKARTIRIVEDEVLPESIELKYENMELEVIATTDDLSALEKLEDRQFGSVNGEDIVLSLYSDSNNKVTGIFKHGDSHFMLPDLGYSHDVESIKQDDLQIGYENDGSKILLLAAMGSDISGYKYVFYDESNDKWLYYHNWGSPEVTDVNGDGTIEVLMQFEGLHNNPADGNILTFKNGQFMVSGINSAIYEKTGFTKGATTVSSMCRQQDEKILVDIELYGDRRMIKSYYFSNDNLESLKEKFEGTGSLVYENMQYGFSFILPRSWGNFIVAAEEWEGMSTEDETGNHVVETGSVINMRHPFWTIQNPRQDIPIMILTIDQWNRLEDGKFHIGSAPMGPKELNRNSKYVFALPARYNYAFLPGYEEVERILGNNPLKPLERTGTETAEDAEAQIVNVYYACSQKELGGLYFVEREVHMADPIQAALEEMLKGPSEEEKKLGYVSHFSNQTENMFNSVTWSEDFLGLVG